MITNYCQNYQSNFQIDSHLLKTQTIVGEKVKKGYDRFEKIWSYAGKSLLATRHILNTTLSSCRWIALTCKTRSNLKNTVLRLKIFSIVSVPLNMLSIPAMFRKVMDNVHWKDTKGVALSTLSLTILASDTLDSITTFVNAVLELSSKPAVGLLSSLGMPLMCMVIGFGSIVRIVKLVDISTLLNKVEGTLLSELQRKKYNSDELKVLLNKFLDDKLLSRKVKDENSQAVLQDLKKHQEAVLERQSNSKVVKLINALAKELESDEVWTEEKTKTIAKILEDIVTALKKELGVQCGFLTANILSAGAMILFSLTGFGIVAIPFILLAASMITRISMQVFQDFS